MKNILYITFICLLSTASAQVAIGKSTVDGSGILDFAENTNMALILPQTNDGIVGVKGSLVYNIVEKKVQFYDGTTWKDLSIKTGNVDTSEIDGYTERGNSIIIGDAATADDGVLVLNMPEKALILPKNITPWENIKNPEPGTITYDTNANLICVYNGVEWTFWGL